MKTTTKKHRFLKLIQKTRLAMHKNIKCVIGCDCDGIFFVTKK